MCPHPGDDGEEGEGDGRPGRVRPLVEWQLVGRGFRPLIGQEAETYEEQEGPGACGEPVEQRHPVTRQNRTLFPFLFAGD